MGTASVQAKKANVTPVGKSLKSKKSALVSHPISTESEDFSGDDSFPVSGEGIDLDWGSIPVDPPESAPRVQAAPEETEEKEIQEKEDKEEVQLKEEAIASAEDEENKIQAKEEDKDLQLKADEEEASPEQEENENIQMKEDASVSDEEEIVQEQENIEEEPIQAKLSIGKPGDKYEQEADRIARKVIQMKAPDRPSVQRQTDSPEEEKIQQKPLSQTISPLVQQCPCDSQPEMPEVQAKGNKARKASASFEKSLSQAKGGGTPLGNETKGFMESHFGSDFSSVRVHTDSNSVQMNKQIGAQAFTHGNNIFYGSGKSPGKNELTAHELTHTIQQNGGAVQPKIDNTEAVKSQPVSEKESQKEGDESSLGWLHTALDIGGFIPGVGALFDLANAGLYAAKGDWANAALSGVAAIPGFGDAAAAVGKGGKLVSKLASKAGKGLSKGNKLAKKGGKFLDRSSDILSKGSDDLGKFSKNWKNKLDTKAGKGASHALGLAVNGPIGSLSKLAGKKAAGLVGKFSKLKKGKKFAEFATEVGVNKGVGLGLEQLAEKTLGEEGKAWGKGAKGLVELKKKKGKKNKVAKSKDKAQLPANGQGEKTGESPQEQPTEAKQALPTDATQPGAENAPEATSNAPQQASEAQFNPGGDRGQKAAPAPVPQTSNETASGGGSVSLSGGGDAQIQEADENAEADAVEQRMAEVAPDNDESDRLSPAEKAVAISALSETPAGGETGGGGGGGGAAIEPKPAPPAPDVSQASPEGAVGTLAGLPPRQVLGGLKGASQAIANTATQEREALANNPPEMETPTGREMSVSEQEVPQGEAPQPVESVPEAADIPAPQPEPTPAPPPAPPLFGAAPAVGGNEEGKVSEADTQNIQASISQLPTTDPNPPNLSAGTPPPLVLEGNANPQRTQEQKAALEQSAADAKVKGQQEIAQPMGENEIYSTVPATILRGEITAGGNSGEIAKGAFEAVNGAAGEMDAASIIAREEKGAEIDAAIAQAQGDISAQREQHDANVAAEKEKSQQEIAQLQQDNAAKQQEERNKAQDEVSQLREEWAQEQDAEIEAAQKEADTLVSDGLQEVDAEKVATENEATTEISKGEEEAEKERQKGEAEAAKEKQKGEEKSSGFFGWAADQVKGAFEGIKNAIKGAIDRARQAMRDAIDRAKTLATEAIERGRQKIVGVIKRVGDAVVAVGDRLLEKFPQTRDKFRNFIQEKVQLAEGVVNQLAENLNQGIQTALNVLGTGLDAALGLMEKGMTMAVDAIGGAVSGALQFAQGYINTVGALAAIIPDIAANPGQWVSNLAAGAKDGVKNHLWGTFQTQVQTWFQGKVQAVIGVAPDMLQALFQGGFDLGKIAGMAWNALKAAIPPLLINLLIEKLVSMIIPAVGAVKTIIESLMAAWGAASQVLAAFNAFLGFLKAVRGGQSGPMFANVLAAAAIAVIDFVSNWLIGRLMKAAKKFAGKLKGIAKGLMKKKDKKKNKKNNKLDKTNKKKGDKDKKDKEETFAEKQKRLDKAVNVGVNLLNRKFSGKKASKMKMKLALFSVKRKYRLKSIDVVKSGNTWQVYGEINPRKKKNTNLRVVGDSSKNEKHGDDGRALSKAEKYITELEEKLETATGKEKTKILNKIKKIKRNAEKKKKGTEHSRGVKR
ncbi:MAG: DUF4157 domain-containing protein [Cyanobacteria bacterium SBLK]|nr:DUF4157 domain-containing protein [Cyanobacteria bacterium SBLK]